MPYKIVTQATKLPQVCSMLPQLGSEHRKGYFDANLRSKGVDPWMYVSVEFVEQAAEQLGWLSPEKHQEFSENAVKDGEKVLELQRELEEVNKELDAIWVIKNKPRWGAEKKPGRPKKVRDYEDTIA